MSLVALVQQHTTKDYYRWHNDDDDERRNDTNEWIIMYELKYCKFTRLSCLQNITLKLKNTT